MQQSKAVRTTSDWQCQSFSSSFTSHATRKLGTTAITVMYDIHIYCPNALGTAVKNPHATAEYPDRHDNTEATLRQYR